MASSNQAIEPPPEWYQLSPICDGIYLSGIAPLADPKIDQLLADYQIGLLISALSENPRVIESHEQVTSTYPEIGCLMICYQDSHEQNLWEPSQNGRVILTTRHGSPESIVALRNLVSQSAEISAIDLAYRAIRLTQASGKKVIVHCAAGVSRSASIVCYYLMKRYEWSYPHALEYLQTRRSIVQPNQSFANQLIAYQNWRSNHGLIARSNWRSESIRSDIASP